MVAFSEKFKVNNCWNPKSYKDLQLKTKFHHDDNQIKIRMNLTFGVNALVMFTVLEFNVMDMKMLFILK